MHPFHPGFFPFWKSHHAGCGPSAHAGCGPAGGPPFGGGPFGRHGHGHHGHGGGDDELGGGSFGVRRPLRFLAYKLDLTEDQVTELARVLHELKTERAQAAVDDRRVTSSFADALGAEAFDAAKTGAAAADRVKSAERLKDAVVKALGEIHAVLEPAQRQKLAYLIRTGQLVI